MCVFVCCVHEYFLVCVCVCAFVVVRVFVSLKRSCCFDIARFFTPLTDDFRALHTNARELDAAERVCDELKLGLDEHTCFSRDTRNACLKRRNHGLELDV